MKLKANFITHNSSDESYLVPTSGAEFSGIVKGNKTLGTIIELLKSTLEPIPYNADVDMLAEKLDGYSCADIVAIANKAKEIYVKRQIIEGIDTTTEIGKRDMAVFLLAMDCGIRSSDICTLKLSEIDWHNASVNIIQKKSQLLFLYPTVPVKPALFLF